MVAGVAMPPAKRKAPAAARGAPAVTARTPAAAAGAPAAAKKTRPCRTPQTPFEQAAEELYSVDKIIGMQINKGNREYLVRWEGYAASHDTWEPIENLVGCAKEIRDYETARAAEDKAAAVAVVAKRQKAKDDAAAAAAALKEQAAAAALDGTDVGAEAGQEGVPVMLSTHANKKCAVWSAYDLTTGNKPSCKLNKEGTTIICGAQPSPAAGTTNYWSHLWTHHRGMWYELKRQSGSLMFERCR